MAILFLSASFGQSQTGLTTVGYTIKTKTGSQYQARSTQGVVELGNGVYGVELTLPDNSIFIVLWDTGSANLRTTHSYVDTTLDAPPVDLSPVLEDLEFVTQEVQGLKEKNIRKVANDPTNPTVINVAVKKDSASDWSPANLNEQYSINVYSNAFGEIERYGG
jgi:hypothetical protein